MSYLNKISFEIKRNMFKILMTFCSITLFTLILFYRKNILENVTLYRSISVIRNPDQLNTVPSTLKQVLTVGPEETTEVIQKTKIDKKISNKTFLIYGATKFARGLASWDKLFYRMKNEECLENRCVLSTKFEDFNKSDAVLVAAENMGDVVMKKLKSLRRPNQLFIYFNIDTPPDNFRGKLGRFANFFNWLMTYRRDSDIFVPYGKVTRRNKSKTIRYLTEKEFKKKKMAIFVSSKCQTKSKRELLVKQLQGKLSVDVYGKCGKKKCGKPSVIAEVSGQNIRSDKCVEMIRNYKFYFAFENSLCSEYLTERLYLALSMGIVPVVYGGVNYSEFAPPNSVIEAKKFGTVAKLSKFLKKVSENVTLYNWYLKWQEKYDIEVGSPYKPLICDLCSKLRSQNPQRRLNFTYKNIEKWTLGGIEKCFKFEDFFKNDKAN